LSSLLSGELVSLYLYYRHFLAEISLLQEILIQKEDQQNT
jgi:hypothetical protein